jgi:hypothetical protein
VQQVRRKEWGLVGIKIQGDYQLHSVELARIWQRQIRLPSKYRRPIWSRLGILCNNTCYLNCSFVSIIYHSL